MDAAAMPQILPGLVEMETKYPWGIQHAPDALLNPWHLLIPRADAWQQAVHKAELQPPEACTGLSCQNKQHSPKYMKC